LEEGELRLATGSAQAKQVRIWIRKTSRVPLLEKPLTILLGTRSIRRSISKTLQITSSKVEAEAIGEPHRSWKFLRVKMAKIIEVQKRVRLVVVIQE